MAARLALRLTFALGVLIALAPSANGQTPVRRAPAVLAAGPMLGPATHRDVTLWVMTDHVGSVAVDYAPVAQDTSGPYRPATAGRVAVVTGPDGVATIAIANLEPGTRYRYSLVVDGEPVERPYPLEFRTQPLWQYRTDPPAFTIAVGSCAYVNDAPYDRPGTPYGGDYQIFEAIAGLNPDAMIWLGDNTYTREVDWESPDGIAYRYAHTRALPEMQRLLATASHYATWDDHDYGPNDSDRSYVLKSASLNTFRRFWPNPTAGLPNFPGVFTQFRWADVDVFLLDDRFHRSPNAAPVDSAKTILGDLQLAWLLDALTASRAPFKLVDIGGQVLPTDEMPGSETYATIAPHERQYLLDEIARRGIEGVVLVSGDVHHTELMRLDRPGTYPLYEFTSSPLTAAAAPPQYARVNSLTVEGTFVQGQRNFGTLTVTGPRTARVLTMRTYDTDGVLLWEHEVAASDLRTPSADR